MAETVDEIDEQEGVSLGQVIAFGDGANDLPMHSIAGLGIACFMPIGFIPSLQLLSFI